MTTESASHIYAAPQWVAFATLEIVGYLYIGAAALHTLDEEAGYGLRIGVYWRKLNINIHVKPT